MLQIVANCCRILHICRTSFVYLPYNFLYMAVVTAFQNSQAKNKLRPASIRFRLNDGHRTQISYSSNLKIAPAYWSNETQSIRAKVAYDEDERFAFNRAVVEIKAKILEWYQEAKQKGAASSAALKQYMADFESAPVKDTIELRGINETYQYYLSESRFSVNRVKQHRVVMRDMDRYMAYKGKILRLQDYEIAVEDFDKQLAREFRFFLESEYLLQAQYPELYIGHNAIEKRGKNTILAKLSALRAFTNWAYNEGLTPHKPFKGMKLDDETYGDPYMLTAEELSRLKRTRLHRHPRLEYYRDTFLFQSALGCRLSDLKALRGVNVSKYGDGVIVEYIAEKTHREHPKVLRIPLNETATEIFRRRLEDSDPHKPLFKFTDQYYNNALKKIFLAARLTRYVNILDSKNGGITQKRLCEVASSHMARRNFISQMFEVFTDQNLVSELSGHAYNSKAFVRYRKVTDKLRKKMVTEALKW